MVPMRMARNAEPGSVASAKVVVEEAHQLLEVVLVLPDDRRPARLVLDAYQPEGAAVEEAGEVVVVAAVADVAVVGTAAAGAVVEMVRPLQVCQHPDGH